MGIPSWDDLRVLLAVHRHRSLYAAGKALGLSTSTTSRRIEALEAALGRRLVTRTRTGTALEADALDLVRLAEDLEKGLEAERRDVRSTAGIVKVSVPDGAVLELAQALFAFRREHPETNIELVAENRLCDLAKREADIGIRLSRSTSHVLVEKHVATLRFGLFASPEYVRRHLPTRRLTATETSRHPFIGLDRQWSHLPHEVWMTSLGAIRFPFRSSSIIAILEAVKQSLGIAALLEHTGRNEGLVALDVDLPAPTQPLYLAYHRELGKVPRVRAVIVALETFVAGYR